jgi:hypothetical protein
MAKKRLQISSSLFELDNTGFLWKNLWIAHEHTSRTNPDGSPQSNWIIVSPPPNCL